MTIVIRPDRAAVCWVAVFGDDGPYVAGTYPLPFTLDAPVQHVAATVRARFPGARVTGVQAQCVGCAS